MRLVTLTTLNECGFGRAASFVRSRRPNLLVVPALNQQGGDDPFNLRGGQDAFEGGREAFFIQALSLHMRGMVGQGQRIDGDGVLHGENRKFMIVNGGGRDGKIINEDVVVGRFLLNGAD